MRVLENSKDADVMYLYLTKGFDKIYHNFLLLKLTLLQLVEFYCNGFLSFTIAQRQKVVVSENSSALDQIVCVVSQSTVW